MKNKTNILHTIETRGPGGAEILIVNHAQFLESKGITNFGFFIKQGWILSKFNELGYTTKLKNFNGFWDLFFFISFIRFITKNKIEIIHAHEFAMSFISTIAGKILNKKVVCTFHGQKYHSDTKLRKKIINFIAKNSSLVVVSNDIKENIIKDKLNLSNKIIVIENGIPVVDIHQDKSLILNELSLEKDAILVGSIGRLHQIKGSRYFVEAAKIVVENNKNVYFLLCGEGEEKEYLQKYITQNNLQKRAFLLGHRDDANYILNSLDIFVLPSLSEGTSLALLEALSVGVQIIATNVGGNRHLLKEKGRGHLVPSKSGKALADKILEIVSSERKNKKNIDNIEFIKSNYSIDVMASKYIKIYNFEK